MGLDQHVTVKETGKELFYWRKHPNMHGFIEKLWRERTGNEEDAFMHEYDLTEADINMIEMVVNMDLLPKTQGFFFGESTPERKTEDLEFIKLAREELAKGNHIYYDSSW